MSTDDILTELLAAQNKSAAWQENIHKDIAVLARALQGEPDSGHRGLLDRVERLEVTVRRLVLVVPAALFGGSALGNFVAKWVGL